jgi:hypothetical protein
MGTPISCDGRTTGRRGVRPEQYTRRKLHEPSQRGPDGVAVVDPHTIVVINDNDFGMSDGRGAFDANGRLIDSGILTRAVVIRLNGVLD